MWTYVKLFFFFSFIYRELLLNNNLLRVLPYELGRLFRLQTLGLKGEFIWLIKNKNHISAICCEFHLFSFVVFMIWLRYRKPFVPRHSQSVPGARWNQKAFELHARQSRRWAARLFHQNKSVFWSILTWLLSGITWFTSSSSGLALCSVHPEQLPQRPWITLKERDQMIPTG